MITKDIVYCGQNVTLACDARCEKAWGNNNRPSEHYDPEDPDDYAFLADNELGNAPVDPGTYKGGHAKPRTPEERLNKWCARECERSTLVDRGKPIVLRSFERRRFNCPKKHPKETP